MTRGLRILALAGMEAVIVGLPLLTLTSIDPGWIVLFGLVIFGWLVDALALRVPRAAERVVLFVGAVIAMVGAIAIALGLSMSAAAATLLPGNDRFVVAYVIGLGALYLFWRGTRIPAADSSTVATLFGRGAGVMLVALLLRPVFRPGTELPATVLGFQVLLFVGLGLFSLALAHADDEGVGSRKLNWRWLLTLGLAIGVVVLLGGLAATLLGGSDALALARGLVQLALLPFAIIGGALAWVFITLFAEPLSRLLQALMAAFPQLQPLVEQADESSELANQPPGEMIVTLATSATWLMALIPLVILFVAILFLRWRARPRTDTTEERESLGVASGLAADLRDLLGRLRNPFAGRLSGLQAVLAGLRGDDPTSRVRRAYVRLLIALEERNQSRPATATPAEFAGLAADTVNAPQEVAALTTAYERARYQPAGATADDAAAAEAALSAASQKGKRR